VPADRRPAQSRRPTTAVYVWRRIDTDGMTFVRIDQSADGVRIAGNEITVEDGQRWATTFGIELNLDWHHQSARLESSSVEGTSSLRIDDLGDYDVIDIAGNPFTNALALRSRPVPIGGSIEVRAAYIEAPALTIRPLTERYRRLEERRWEYSDDEFGAFVLDVDDELITVEYERLATRVR
jgi:uncharacterized protein